MVVHSKSCSWKLLSIKVNTQVVCLGIPCSFPRIFFLWNKWEFKILTRVSNAVSLNWSKNRNLKIKEKKSPECSSVSLNKALSYLCLGQSTLYLEQTLIWKESLSIDLFFHPWPLHLHFKIQITIVSAQKKLSQKIVHHMVC